jgi:predicted RNA binding protein YcfA (HicA-like mRNA interferase family)
MGRVIGITLIALALYVVVGFVRSAAPGSHDLAAASSGRRRTVAFIATTSITRPRLRASS